MRDYTRALPADYQTEKSTIQWCIRSATEEVSAAAIGWFTAQTLKDGTASIELRVEVKHWNSDEARFIGKYSGDPAGRARVYIYLCGYRFEYAVHCEGIYTVRPEMNPAELIGRSVSNPYDPGSRLCL
jgi:hypothetical protein